MKTQDIKLIIKGREETANIFADKLSDIIQENEGQVDPGLKAVKNMFMVATKAAYTKEYKEAFSVLIEAEHKQYLRQRDQEDIVKYQKVIERFEKDHLNRVPTDDALKEVNSYRALVKKLEQRINSNISVDTTAAENIIKAALDDSAWLDNEETIKATANNAYKKFWERRDQILKNMSERFNVASEEETVAQISAPVKETAKAVVEEEPAARPAEDHRAAFLARMAQRKNGTNKTAGTNKKTAESLKESFLQKMAAVKVAEETVVATVTTVKEVVVNDKKTVQAPLNLKNSFLAKLRSLRASKTA